jgi:redox-sensitive bicupin YhaK (pirin superfamily)
VRDLAFLNDHIMIRKIDNTMFTGHGPIKVLYPGIAVSKTDSGIGSIGRIDHPEFHGNTIIRMHPHVNDEIVSYFRSGLSEHKDSEGIIENIDKHKLMFMKAGRSFYHEEKIFGTDEPLEGLQIFIRPGAKDLDPKVVFMDLEHIHSENKWRILGSPTNETNFQFSSQTWLYDMKLPAGHEAILPELPQKGLTYLLYVFKGSAIINNDITLAKKESVVVKDEHISIKANEDTEFVLFVTDENAEIFKGGMYSGNQN